jgi:hypothetical protein
MKTEIISGGRKGADRWIWSIRGKRVGRKRKRINEADGKFVVKKKQKRARG